MPKKNEKMRGGWINFLVSTGLALAAEGASSAATGTAFNPLSLIDPFGFIQTGIDRAKSDDEKKRQKEEEYARKMAEYIKNKPIQDAERAYKRELEFDYRVQKAAFEKNMRDSRSILSRKPGTVVSGRTHAPVQGLPSRLATPANKLATTPDGRNPIIQKTFATGMNQRVSLGQAPPPPPNPQPPAQPPTTQLSKRYIAAAAANQRRSGALFGGM